MNEIRAMLGAGSALLNELKESIGEKEYNKILHSPIHGCKCGNIKEGDDTVCNICESSAKSRGTKK